MITGAVTRDREAIIPIIVRGTSGQSQEVEAIIDTGFDGSLSLPPSLIAQLGLMWRQRGRALLADGTETLFDMYEATVIWDTQPRRIIVDEADTAPLVGMSLLADHRLIIDVRVGGSVMISALL